jgi:hypothetical protein
MSLTDGLSIAPGRGQGEAVILPQTTFDPIRFSQSAMMMIEAENQKRKLAENEKAKQAKSLVQSMNDPIAQWDTDQINFFTPRINERKQNVVKFLSENGGKLTDEQNMEIQSQGLGLKQDIELSNQQKKFYDDVIKKVYTKKDSKDVYDGQTQINVAAWGYPQRNKDVTIINAEGETTTVGEELKKYDNNPIKFREANKHLATDLKESWYLDEQANQISQRIKPVKSDNLTSGYVGPFKGILQTETKKYTPAQIAVIEKSLKEENKAEFSRQVRELTKYLSEKDKQKLELQAGVEAGILNSDGTVKEDFYEKLRTSTEQEVEKMAPAGASERDKDDAIQLAMRNKMNQIIDEAYDSKLFKTYWENKFPQEVQKNFNQVSDGNSNGAGFDPRKDINWTDGQYNVNASDYLAMKYPDKASYYQSEEFKAKPENKKSIEKINSSLGRDYVAFNFKSGKDNPAVVFDGAEIKPTGIYKGLDGKPYLIGSAQMSSQDSILSVIAALRDEDISAEKKEELKKKFGIKMIDLSDKGNQTEIANKLGFKDSEDFYSFVTQRLKIKDYSKYAVTK